MRRTALLLTCLAFLAPLPALAQVSQSGTVTAAIQVPQSMALGLSWLSNGNSHRNFGSVQPNSTATDEVVLSVTHTMPAATTFAVQANVTKTGGPAWVENVNLQDGASQYLIWTQATFGTAQSFTNAIGGAGSPFTKNYLANFNVAGTQAPSEYAFELTFTVSSL